VWKLEVRLVSAEVTNKSLLVGFLVLLLAALADGGLKKEQASILSQVQVIEEPELAELIEVAILRSTNPRIRRKGQK